MINSRRLRNVVTAGLAVLLLCGGLSVGSSTRRASDGLLRIVPGRSLFCVRINKFENTIEAVNEFLKDVAPASFDQERECCDFWRGRSGRAGGWSSNGKYVYRCFGAC